MQIGRPGLTFKSHCLHPSLGSHGRKLRVILIFPDRFLTCEERTQPIALQRLSGRLGKKFASSFRPDFSINFMNKLDR